jgi:hypothetical protein
VLQPTDLSNSYTALRDNKRIPSLTVQASQKITNFYQQMKGDNGKKLAALHSTPLNLQHNYCQMLKEIAEEQRFEVTYVDIKDVSATGMCITVYLFVLHVEAIHSFLIILTQNFHHIFYVSPVDRNIQQNII